MRTEPCVQSQPCHRQCCGAPSSGGWLSSPDRPMLCISPWWALPSRAASTGPKAVPGGRSAPACGSVLPPPGCGGRGPSPCLTLKTHPHEGLPVVTDIRHPPADITQPPGQPPDPSGHVGRGALHAPSVPSRGPGAPGLTTGHSGQGLPTRLIHERMSQPLSRGASGCPVAQLTGDQGTQRTAATVRTEVPRTASSPTTGPPASALPAARPCKQPPVLSERGRPAAAASMLPDAGSFPPPLPTGARLWLLQISPLYGAHGHMSGHTLPASQQGPSVHLWHFEREPASVLSPAATGEGTLAQRIRPADTRPREPGRVGQTGLRGMGSVRQES